MKSKLEESAARKPGRPAVDRREEILDAAERLYDDIGFEKTTIGDVARELGMSPANLYRSFENRHAIDEAITSRKLIVLEDTAWRAARAASIDPAKAFRSLVFDVMRQTNSLFFGSEKMNRLCAVAMEARWPVVELFVHNLRGAVRHVVIEGQNVGIFAPGDPDRIAGAVFIALSKLWNPAMLAISRNDDLESEADALCDLLLAGLHVK